MSGEGWICRNDKQFKMFCDHILKTWDWSKPLSIQWQDGITKSLGQLALIHVWIRVITAHMNKLPGNDYDEETVKTYLKRKFGVQIVSRDLLTGEPMPALKSYSKYLKGEMTLHMNRVSEFSADIGCLLPVWGEYEQTRNSA